MNDQGPTVPRGVRRLFRLPPSRERLERDAQEEMEFHLTMWTAEFMARGMSEADARVAARARFGSSDAYGEYVQRRAGDKARRERAVDWFAGWAQDVRFAARQVRKAPAFTTLAVLTLALGIGANTAIFSVIQRVLLAPLPYPNASRLVMPMQIRDPMRGDARVERQSVDASLIRAWQARSQAVEAIAGASEAFFSVDPDGVIDTIPSAPITANFLPILGVQPVLGRGFAPADERPADQVGVAMISYALWQRMYDGRADVLGRTVSLDGRPLTIVGVTPPDLNIPLSPNPPPDIWVPEPLEQAVDGWNGVTPGPTLFAVLRPGSSVEAASRELQAVAATLPQLGREHARLRVMRAQDFVDPRETRALQVLFVAVGALLLIACANVANLLLVRAWARQREFAVRTALGAGRRRLARLVLTESLSLALAGGMLGVGVAWLTLRVVVALRPPALAHLADVRLDPTVLLWTLGVSIGTGIVFGSVPAFVAGARTVGDVLRRETRSGSPGVASRRLRSALIVLEIALSLVLLVSSGLLVRSFAALQRMPLGFEPRGLVYTDVVIGGPREQSHPPVVRDAILARLRALPGVTGVAVGTMPGKGYIDGGLEAETDQAGHTTRVPVFGVVFISPNYFGVARIALGAGRLPDSTGLTPTGPAVIMLSPEVVVNRALARRLRPDGRVVGSRVRLEKGWHPPGQTEPPWSTVVGVVDDARMPNVLGDIATLQLYTVSAPQLRDVPFVVRTAMSGDLAAPEIKHAIASADPRIFVRPMLSGDRYLRDGLAPTRFAMALLTAFALLALVLAAVGLYGVIAYSVTQRTREIGIRVALGAEGGGITTLIMRDGLRLAAAGVAFGGLAAVAATRSLRGLLYGVTAGDPTTYFGIGLLVAAIAVLASYVPARRAVRIDPLEALRTE